MKPTSEQLRAATDATVRLHHEMRVRFAPVPEWDGPTVYDDGDFALAPDRFRFVTPGGVRFFYRIGEGLTADLPDAAAEPEFALYHWGTVFGAVAWLAGLFPLHASAVDIGGRAIAFTADSGGGKSTLAAALAQAGLPHVADDTLPLLVDDAGIFAVPDRKPLKLWKKSLDLTGLEAAGEVGLIPGKFYTSPPHKAVDPLPVTDLVLLSEGSRVSIEPITGAAKLAVLAEAMYRNFVPAAIADDEMHHRQMIALATRLRVWCLKRPMTDDAALFSATLDQVKAEIGRLDRR